MGDESWIGPGVIFEPEPVVGVEMRGAGRQSWSMQRRVLDRFVENISLVHSTPGVTTRRIDYLPDGKATLIFRWLASGQGELGVRGPRNVALYKVGPVVPLAAVVVFRAGGAYPFFGVPVSALVDEMVPLEQLWPDSVDRIVNTLVAAAERQGDVVAALEDVLVERLRLRPLEPVAPMAARAAVALMNQGERRIGDVAAELGLSKRHLRRAFTATVGVGPKTYARIARFQRALRLGRDAPWGEVAHAAGYFDQAHLSGEFRRLALRSPDAFHDDAAVVRRGC
jgi:AraC-like DNA-binding protein